MSTSSTEDCPQDKANDNACRAPKDGGRGRGILVPVLWYQMLMQGGVAGVAILHQRILKLHNSAIGMVIVTNELSFPKFQTNGILQKMQNVWNVRCQSEKVSSTVQSFGRRVRSQSPHFHLARHDKVTHNVRVQISRPHDTLFGRQ